MDLASLLSVAVALLVALCGYLLLVDDLPRFGRVGRATRRRR